MTTNPMPSQQAISFSDLGSDRGALPIEAGPMASAVLVAYGEVTANGASTVVEANAAVTANSIIILTIKTPAGTPSPTAPNVIAKVAGVSFSIQSTALDTSVYQYIILG